MAFRGNVLWLYHGSLVSLKTSEVRWVTYNLSLAWDSRVMPNTWYALDQCLLPVLFIRVIILHGGGDWRKPFCHNIKNITRILWEGMGDDGPGHLIAAHTGGQEAGWPQLSASHGHYVTFFVSADLWVNNRADACLSLKGKNWCSEANLRQWRKACLHNADPRAGSSICQLRAMVTICAIATETIVCVVYTCVCPYVCACAHMSMCV